MATENWSAAELANRPSLEDFHSAFDVVFIDTTGYVNLCADMSAVHYRLVFTLLMTVTHSRCTHCAELLWS